MSIKDKFGFGKKDKDEKPEVNEVKDMQEATIEKARLCLHSEPFKDFVEEYRQAERATIDILLKLSIGEPDPLIFGYQAKNLLSKISHIKTMLNSTHLKAGERYEDV